VDNLCGSLDAIAWGKEPFNGTSGPFEIMYSGKVRIINVLQKGPFRWTSVLILHCSHKVNMEICNAYDVNHTLAYLKYVHFVYWDTTTTHFIIENLPMSLLSPMIKSVYGMSIRKTIVFSFYISTLARSFKQHLEPLSTLLCLLS
jgi:hypothetical protein